MSIFENLGLPKKATEAGWHAAIEKSFLFILPASDRSLSDDLITELFREIFFEKVRGGKLLKPIDPNEQTENMENVFSDNETYSLYMSAGKETKKEKERPNGRSYMPLYPTLARSSWFRSSQERAVKDLFLRPIAQYLHGVSKNPDDQAITDLKEIHKAFLGMGQKKNGNPDDVAGLKFDNLKGLIGEEEGIVEERSFERLEDLCSKYSELASDVKKDRNVVVKYNDLFTYSDRSKDPLATHFFEDLKSLCELEERIDRLQWMKLLKTFMRLSTSVWLLAKMNITIKLRDRILEFLSDKEVLEADKKWVDEMVKNRVKGIFRPTLNKTHQIDKHVKKYVNARIELNILMAVIEKFSGSDWADKEISIDSFSGNALTIEQVFSSAAVARDKIMLEIGGGGLSFPVLLRRHCESYSSWRGGSTSGPYKNYTEYLLMLRKSPQEDEDGGYLTATGKQPNMGYKLFPGNLMLKLMCHLAFCRFKDRGLVLADVEEQFRLYGIDFGEKGSIRPRLIDALQELGLLNGTPDAGSSAAINRPYPKSVGGR